MEQLNSEKWVSFYFNSNQFWGFITDREEWKHLIAHYSEFSKTPVQLILRAKRKPETTRYPDFGLYMEYVGNETLEDFFKKNEMVI